MLVQKLYLQHSFPCKQATSLLGPHLHRILASYEDEGGNWDNLPCFGRPRLVARLSYWSQQSYT